MNIYEELLQEAFVNNIIVKEVALKSNSDGLYYNNKIALNKSRLHTIKQKSCVLAEEIGHHFKNVGDIIDLSDTDNLKQEYKARVYAYNKLIGLNGLINAFKDGCQTLHEFIDYLGVTIEFFNEAINCYKNKYGLCIEVDNYVILFEPTLMIVEQFASEVSK